ncbi:MAG: hypothetical protein KGJ03_10080 [Betaproteobacteria bacterium]|nr:hypothetical protein [Betaproteobacteria bacterium]MBU6510998.1 hypothetical protein [Betaproteobacteria bacterium]MDE1956060.1 hypothetical protein [Betaproteobacteria bacterium]MDE2150764.1 hypothetical protein [Betaproteobacteria bacterium]MDE2479377.1 hypothetical protein [Betaproteobacteria bacterium]
MGRAGRQSGPKPAIAFVTQAEAVRNLERKLDTLGAALDWIKDRHDAPAADALLVVLPASLRQFCAWQAKGLLDGFPGRAEFGKNAPQTLRASAGLTARATALLDAVRQCKAQRSRAHPREEKLSAIRSKALLAQRLQSAAEARLVDALREVQSLQDEILRLRTQLDSLSNASTAAIQSKEKENERLHRELKKVSKRGATNPSQGSRRPLSEAG